MKPELNARIEDKILIEREFTRDIYKCEMTVWSDDVALYKFGSRGMFGWIDIFKDDKRVAKVGYTITKPLNDWDLNPRYVEFALLAKLDMLFDELNPSPHGLTFAEIIDKL